MMMKITMLSWRLQLKLSLLYPHQDANASDGGAEDDSAHLSRRVMRSSGELSSISDKAELNRKPLPTRPKPTKGQPTARKKDGPLII